MSQNAAELGKVAKEAGFTALGVSVLAYQRLAVLRRDIERNGAVQALGSGLSGSIRTLRRLFSPPA